MQSWYSKKMQKLVNRLRLHHFSAALVCTLMLVFATQSQAAYITDQFQVMFRAGPSIQNKIIRPLASDTYVDVVIADAGNGHSQVRTQRGEVGYVLSRFISEQTPARLQVQSLTAQLDELTSDPAGIESQLRDKLEENTLLIEQNMSLTEEVSNVKTTLEEVNAAAGGVLEIRAENQRLQTQVNQLLLQLDDFRIQNDTLRDSSDRRTMLISASLVVLGLFLGWLLTRSKRRGINNSW